MKINELMEAAAEGYPDKGLLMCWNKFSHSPKVSGDTLALFVVRELQQTFRSRASSATQLKDASAKLGTAIGEMEGVKQALDNALEADAKQEESKI